MRVVVSDSHRDQAALRERRAGPVDELGCEWRLRILQFPAITARGPACYRHAMGLAGWIDSVSPFLAKSPAYGGVATALPDLPLSHTQVCNRALEPLFATGCQRRDVAGRPTVDEPL